MMEVDLSNNPSNVPPDIPSRVPVTDDLLGTARTYASVISPVLVVMIASFGLRIYSRWKMFHSDDWVITAAFVFALLDWLSMFTSVAFLLTHKETGIPFSQAMTLAHLSPVAAVSAAWAVACVKASVGLSLLRLQRFTRWERFLWAIIILQGIIATFQTIMMTTRCVPLEGTWNPLVTDKTCWGVDAFRISFTTTSVLVIFTDFIFAATPLTFLTSIRVSWRHRLVIGVLMAAGLFASGASIAKTLAIQAFEEAEDMMVAGLRVGLWASLEVQVGVVAACLPCLKATFERGFARLRVIATNKSDPDRESVSST